MISEAESAAWHMAAGRQRRLEEESREACLKFREEQIQHTIANDSVADQGGIFYAIATLDAEWGVGEWGAPEWEDLSAFHIQTLNLRRLQASQ